MTVLCPCDAQTYRHVVIGCNCSGLYHLSARTWLRLLALWLDATCPSLGPRLHMYYCMTVWSSTHSPTYEGGKVRKEEKHMWSRNSRPRATGACVYICVHVSLMWGGSGPRVTVIKFLFKSRGILQCSRGGAEIDQGERGIRRGQFTNATSQMRL